MVRSRSDKPVTKPAEQSEVTIPVTNDETPPVGTGGHGNPRVVNSRDTDGDPPASKLPFKGKVPPLPDGYQTIVESVFTLPDPNVVYEEVLAGIRPIRASRATMAELLDALDGAQAIAMKARGLLVNAKATFDTVARDTQILVASMRDQATSQLEWEKESGLRKKTITEADVVHCLSTMFPDEWSAVQERESKAKRSIDLIENMCERAVERARDLRAIVGASRSV